MPLPMAAAWLLFVLIPADAKGGRAWTYRARVTLETEAASSEDRWRASHVFVAAADGAWEQGRWKAAGGLVATGNSAGSMTLVTREAYARLSAASWLDVEAGKRLLRWGVGYGFAPTGVLDPPRTADDPADRFSRREGVPLARADFFAGETAVTVAVARHAGEPVAAARVKRVFRGGFDVSLVAAAREGRRPSLGASITHVAGQRLEWHAEVLSHESPAGAERTLSGVGGVQYTFAGTNVVLEYHRRAGHYLFARAARAGADAHLQPEVILMRSLGDGTWTGVAGLGVRLRAELDLHVRGTSATGVRALAFGGTVRF